MRGGAVLGPKLVKVSDGRAGKERKKVAYRFGAAFSESNVRIAKIAQMAREAMDRFIGSTKMAG